jgi:5-methyltetrahydrofolate--homocysteine methyltransferase
MANYEALKEAVIDGNVARAREMTQRALNEGARPQDILDSALISAMDVVGEKFGRGELFIPEMLVSARAMQAGLTLLKPLLVAGESRARGRVVIGTVKGDLHDIGKNLVSMMLQGGGFEVVDLGTDVKPSRFVEAVQVEKPDFLMMSALLTTTMLAMQETIDAFKAAGLRGEVKIGVGGAPVTQQFAEQIGADFYAPDAAGAVGKARESVVRA